MSNRIKNQFLALSILALVLLGSASDVATAATTTQTPQTASALVRKIVGMLLPNSPDSPPPSPSRSEPTHFTCNCGGTKVACLVGYSKDCESCCARYEASKKPGAISH